MKKDIENRTIRLFIPVSLWLINEAENGIRFFVKDTGIGIQAEKQGLVFEKFRQIDDSRTRVFEGNGLGLALVQAFAKLLGSKIKLKSEIGVGSEFYFDFPIVNEN